MTARAARKARSAQRKGDRARHAAAIQNALTDELDEWARRAEAIARLDAVLAACDRCGLVQVSSGPNAYWRRDLDEPFAVCVVCACPYATFVETIDGNPVR